MKYIEERIMEALGKEQVIGGQGMTYGDWSPNNVRGIHIFQDSVVIEHHVGPMTMKTISASKARTEVLEILSSGRRSTRNPFSDILSRKSFKNIEEVSLCKEFFLAPSGEPIYASLIGAVTQHVGGRLRAIAYHQQSAATQMDQLRALRKNDVNQLLVQVAPNLRTQVAWMNPNPRAFIKEIGLSPTAYPLDIIGGPLETALKERDPSARLAERVAETHARLMAVDDKARLSLLNLRSTLSMGKNLDDHYPALKEARESFIKSVHVMMPKGLGAGESKLYSDPQFLNVFEGIFLRGRTFDVAANPEVATQYLNYYSDTSKGYLMREDFVTGFRKMSEVVVAHQVYWEVLRTVSLHPEKEVTGELEAFFTELQDSANPNQTLAGLEEVLQKRGGPKPAATTKVPGLGSDIQAKGADLLQWFKSALTRLTEKEGAKKASRPVNSAGVPVLLESVTTHQAAEIARFLDDSERRSINKIGDGPLDFNIHQYLSKAATGVAGLEEAVKDLKYPDNYIKWLRHLGYFAPNTVDMAGVKANQRKYAMLSGFFYFEKILKDNLSNLSVADRQADKGKFETLVTYARKAAEVD